MEKKDVINFFDNLAEGWDAEQIPKDAIIEKILENGGVEPHKDILDIACGTGTLFPFYFKRKVKSVTGIDISPEMVKIAKSKFPETEIICGDAEEYDFDKNFDIIMIYNAFPHFPNPEMLIKNLSQYLKGNGRFTIAHFNEQGGDTKPSPKKSVGCFFGVANRRGFGRNAQAIF